MNKERIFFSLLFIGLYICSFLYESIYFSFLTGIFILLFAIETKLKIIIIPTVILLICSFGWTIFNNMPSVWIFTISFILVVGYIFSCIYNSKNEKLKRATTLLLVAFFCWIATKEQSNSGTIGILLFVIIAGFIIYIWDKMDKEEKDKKNIEKEKNNFFYTISAYGAYLESHPLGIKEIRHLNVLPFNKNELIVDSLLYIKLLNENIEQKDFIEALLISIPQLAFYRSDIPLNGYKSKMDKLIEHTSEMKEEEILEMLSNELSDKHFLNDLSDEDFPNDLFIECQKECEALTNLLKKRLQ